MINSRNINHKFLLLSFFLTLFLFSYAVFSSPLQTQQLFKRDCLLMQSQFVITVVTADVATARQYFDMAENEILRIEKVISSWDVNSETSKVVKNAGIRPVKVSKELFNLIERSIAISKLTDGAFDISYASMDKIWKFDGTMTKKPTEKQIKASIEKVGYENVILNKKNRTVFLKIKGMKIGFGGIGKGYAADKVKQLLQSKGVIAGIINASGDMNTWGKLPNGKDWTVAIANPMNKNQAYAILPIKYNAVATSGNYEKFVIFEDTRYSHIINPKTGYPSKGIGSVTIFSSSGELSDALATSVFVLGIETGIDRINQIPKVDCILVDDKGNIHTSKNISINGQ